MPPGVDPSLSAFFERPADALLADGWRPLELQAGQRLCNQDDAADSVAWVQQGLVGVEVDGIGRGRIGPGELIGEASAFVPNERRSATVVALEPTRMWVLPRSELSSLRGNNVAFYDMILRAAIETMARRIGNNDRERARRRELDPLLARRSGPKFWARVRRTFERPDAPPPTSEALAALPNLPRSGVLLADIEAIAEPRWLKSGATLCNEGDPARSMYIVARGALRVVLSSKDGPIELARIGPGALLGTAAVLHDCNRTASLIADEPTWVYELARERVETLSAGAWRMLAESLLAVMREQLVISNKG